MFWRKKDEDLLEKMLHKRRKKVGGSKIIDIWVTDKQLREEYNASLDIDQIIRYFNLGEKVDMALDEDSDFPVVIYEKNGVEYELMIVKEK